MSIATAPYIQKNTNRFIWDDEKVKLIACHPHILGNLVGFTLLTELHSQWILYMFLANGEHRSLQAHRGSYKTTCEAVGIVWSWLWTPNKRFAMIRETYSKSVEIVATVRRIMNNPIVRDLFKFVLNIKVKALVNKESALRYNFKTDMTPEGNLTAHGLDMGLTGKHYDDAITDDIITLKDRVSIAKRESTKTMIQEIRTNIVDRDGGNQNWGTPWHRDDGWNLLPPAVKFDCYQTGLISEKQLELIKSMITRSMFSANYELTHIPDEGNIFKEIHYCNLWQFLRGIITYAHVDAAYDGNHTNGFTIMSESTNGKKQAVGWVYLGNVKDWIPFIVEKCRQYRVNMLFMETNADKGFCGDKIGGYGISVVPYPETQNKHVKISTFLYDEWNNIEWIAKPHYKETPEEENMRYAYLNQILDYREGEEPDDAPDSGASLIKCVKLNVNSWAGLYGG